MDAADALVGDYYRQEAGKIAAWLARLLGPSRLDLIEDAVQDAFGTALVRWPLDGMPARPGAWLATAARNKALDRLKHASRSSPFDEQAAWRLGFCDPAEVGRLDDTLALMFVACDPALDPDEQVMLTLKTVCGFDVGEIARAYLSTADAVIQRLVRAKRKIRERGLRFEIPDGDQLAERLPVLVQAIYLLFNGGYTAGAGEALIEPLLCAEALRLTDLLTQHRVTGGNGEVHALAALMCFHHARAATRVGEAGELILLAEQARENWDQALIARGFGHLRRAMSSTKLTALHAEAGIASVHAAAPRFAETDWAALSHHYALLEELKPTPVVRLNAAIAVAYAEGAAAGLVRLDELGATARLHRYPPYHAARGDLLQRLGRHDEARGAFGRALDCPLNRAERDHLLKRQQACAADGC
ncbi:MAG: hypothetical protein JO001_20020 [Alphaproteobacteria bacterium]|nr:hypothetical protein [Alphaproteobacteria bacterium]